MTVEVALVTERRYENPAGLGTHAENVFAENVLEEDRLLSEALGALGIRTRRVDWSRADVDWDSFAAVVLRTPWDYFDRFEAFSAWLDARASHRCLLNDIDTVRWNIDKHYLAELESAGVPIVPTVFVERGENTSLSGAMATLSTDSVVYKPVVSGAARETYRVRAGEAKDHDDRFSRLTAERSMMVQPFVASVVEQGEVTVVAMQGEPTHGVVKRAKAGDFRVQDDHGGTVHAHEPAQDELDLARAALAVRGSGPVYGRVDMVRDAGGTPRIMELELVEPELWLRFHPPAAVAMAQGIAGRL